MDCVIVCDEQEDVLLVETYRNCTATRITVTLASVDSSDILDGMNAITRSATVQMRVTPAVKHASEEILHRIGLNMTQAMELFLRRVIVDQKLPFEVTALDQATLTMLAETEFEGKDMRTIEAGTSTKRKRKNSRKKRE